MSEVFSIRLPKEFVSNMKAYCNDNNIDRSKWIRTCLERELGTSIKAAEYINEVMEKNK